MMDVILAVDAVVPPLTGIGRYAYELSQRLPAHPQVIGNHRAGITNGYVARVSAAARPERSAPIAPPLRMAAISAGEASISPRVFWEKRP